MTRRRPPNASRARPRLTRSDWSMAHMRSERTIDTSSMTRSFKRRMTAPLRLRRISSARMRRGGNPKNECSVCPPTLTAASPVGARTASSPGIKSRSARRSVDFPVPARPVTNRCPSPPRRKSTALAYSCVGVTPAGHGAAACGSMAGAGRGRIGTRSPSLCPAVHRGGAHGCQSSSVRRKGKRRPQRSRRSKEIGLVEAQSFVMTNTLKSLSRRKSY